MLFRDVTYVASQEKTRCILAYRHLEKIAGNTSVCVCVNQGSGLKQEARPAGLQLCQWNLSKCNLFSNIQTSVTLQNIVLLCCNIVKTFILPSSHELAGGSKMVQR